MKNLQKQLYTDLGPLFDFYTHIAIPYQISGKFQDKMTTRYRLVEERNTTEEVEPRQPLKSPEESVRSTDLPPMTDSDVKTLIKENVPKRLLAKALSLWELSLRHQVSISSTQLGQVKYQNPPILGS